MKASRERSYSEPSANYNDVIHENEDKADDYDILQRRRSAIDIPAARRPSITPIPTARRPSIISLMGRGV
eukprot:CAMPEP_0184662380 /NCGR_PEP_ID=MMETSP0308-20130426/42996_1 /TAXON_ID=38269 /ORGANISM="Gloeochaete witrockiana, Strain SAG 46.84" /LENGTH=69 /DNA_ID=CAMNT_0027104375 /DNA_START=458 /DNA_END=667 /DNA_ORIENTATION=+